MSTAFAERRRVAGALLYLLATSLAGALLLRLRRLRQPRYLLGALALLGYFAMMLGPALMQADHAPAARHFTPFALSWLGSVLAVFVLLWVVLIWLWPGDRASLRFSEAEVAFLFPAPLSRVSLINFSLLRAQLAIFLSAFLLSLLFGRGRGLPGNALQHATAIWILMASLRLHAFGASFTHARFAERGSRGWVRRVLLTGFVLLLVSAVFAWVALHAPQPPSLDARPKAFVHWMVAVLQTPPVSVLLAPFELLSAPLVGVAGGWWRALWPALLLLALHYAWVVRANVAFEEASIENAQRRATRAAAMREGRWSFTGRRKARAEPFPLAARGPVPLAFLWQGLIGSGGGFWRPRNVALIFVALVALVLAIAATPWQRYLPPLAGAAWVAYAMAGFLAPTIVQRRLRETLDVLDIYKAAPLHGWEIALGQLLTPAVLAALAQWTALAVVALCALFGGYEEYGSGLWARLAGAALLGPLLCAVMMCIPFAWVLWFPAWASAMSSSGGGFEAAGQRVIFAFAYFVLAALALAPALLLGGATWWLLGMLVGSAPGLLAGILLAGGVLVAELRLLVRTLGWKIDRFDLSTELR